MFGVLSKYTNGNSLVTLYEDGTKERILFGFPDPKFPESLDIKITNWCDGACVFCHEQSTKFGKHANLEPTIKLLKQLPEGVEIAIGGGHALSHPQFEDFITELSQSGIICNVTVNEKHFKKELPRLEKYISSGLIYGIGYSYSTTPCDWSYEHLVTHLIIGITPPSKVDEIIKHNKKILLLGYKSFGRGIKYKEKNIESIENNITLWYRNLFSLVKKAHVSFDNLAIKQLNPKRLFKNKNDYNKFFMGGDGKFSMYLDAVKQQYATNSCTKNRTNYSDDISKMFKTLVVNN